MLRLLLLLLGKVLVSSFSTPSFSTPSIYHRGDLSALSSSATDAIVVGSGVGGLTASLLLTSLYDRSTLLLESHPTSLGGVAHTFAIANRRGQFIFDAGPSLLTGLSKPSLNPLRQAFDMSGTTMPEMIEYDGWQIHSFGTREEQGVGADVDVGSAPQDGKFWLSYKMSTSDFSSSVHQAFGREAAELFTSFTSTILSKNNLYDASGGIPPFALRGDKLAFVTLASYYLNLLRIGPIMGNTLTGTFRAVYDRLVNSDNSDRLVENSDNSDNSSPAERFLRNHFDYLSFALSGYDMARTQAAPVAYMVGDLHLPGANINFPTSGGAIGPIIDAMAEKIEQHGESTIIKGTTVTSLIMEGGRCVGVNAVDVRGEMVSYRSEGGVILNVPIWSVPAIIRATINETAGDEKRALNEKLVNALFLAKTSKRSGSFVHVYIGVPVDDDIDIEEIHHSVIMDWGKPIDAKQNMVIISIPTVFDSSLAPEGFHTIHAYTAASDDFNEFAPFLKDEERPRSSEDGEFADNNCYKNNEYSKLDEYNALKMKQAQVLFDAIERVIPDIRERVKHDDAVVEIGTPLTHRRFNRRAFGAYGPGVDEDGEVWTLLQTGDLNIPGLFLAGDSTFPGIGIPGVASSGTIAANSFVGVGEQLREIKRGRKEKILQ